MLLIKVSQTHEPKPKRLTEKDIIRYIGKQYNEKSEKQREFIKFVASLQRIREYETKNGIVSSYLKTHGWERTFERVWTKNEEGIIKLNSLKNCYLLLGHKYTKCAIRNKRLRLLGRKV
jgi:hypothetical protein